MRVRTGLAAVLVLWAAWLPTELFAGGLKDTVISLYGGNGIQLEPFFGHQPHFTASSLNGLDQLNSIVSPNLALFAFNSTFVGYTFDIERGVPVRSTESFGPLIAERANTLGKRTLDLAFAYTQRDFKKLQGVPLSEQSLTFIHEDSCPAGGDGMLGPPGAFPCEFELDQVRVALGLRVKQEIYALYANYGLTRDWDVGIVIPVVQVQVRADALATIIDNSPLIDAHFFGPNSDSPTSSAGGEATGVGDVLLRTKHNLLRNDPIWPDVAVRGQIKLPTGNADDLLGTGATNFQGLLIASKRVGWLTPHVNVGYEATTGDSRLNNVMYLPGFDAQVHHDINVALDILGFWRPNGIGIGDHLVDLVPQVKYNLFRTTIAYAAVQLPLNKNEGLRPDFAWSVGAGATF